MGTAVANCWLQRICLCIHGEWWLFQIPATPSINLHGRPLIRRTITLSKWPPRWRYWICIEIWWRYSWIVCQLEVGSPIITFAVEVQFQIGDQFWIPQPKLRGWMYLIVLVKPKKGLIWPVFTFFYIFVGVSYLASISWAQNRCFSEPDTHYERNSGSLNTTFKKNKNRCFVLNYRWYARAQFYRAHADQLDFLN